VTLTGPDADIEAHQVSLTLAKDQRALKTLEAVGNMYAKLEGGRETMGDRLVYDPATETHQITGRPLWFKNVQNDGGKQSCSMEKSTELFYEGKDQTINEPPNNAGALRASTQLACDKPFKTAVAELKALSK